MSALSYVTGESHCAWAIYLSQVERVLPLPGDLNRWANTLRHPERALIVDVLWKWMTGRFAILKAFGFSIISLADPAKGACAITPTSACRR